MRVPKALLMLFLFCPLVGFAQVDKLLSSLSTDSTWRRGSLFMNDNRILKGLVRFDGISGRIGFKKTADDDTQMIVVTKVAAAEIMDGDRPRMFANYEVETENGMDNWLCEVIMETQHFVVLSHRRAEILGKESVTRSYPSIKAKSNSERFLLAWNDSQTAEVVAYLPNFQNNGDKFDESYVARVTPLPDYNEDIVLKYMESHKAEVKQYLKKNKVRDVIGGSANPTLREDVVALFQFYQGLERE